MSLHPLCSAEAPRAPRICRLVPHFLELGLGEVLQGREALVGLIPQPGGCVEGGRQQSGADWPREPPLQASGLG